MHLGIAILMRRNVVGDESGGDRSGAGTNLFTFMVRIPLIPPPLKINNKMMNDDLFTKYTIIDKIFILVCLILDCVFYY
jgi:hypothetical protein